MENFTGGGVTGKTPTSNVNSIPSILFCSFVLFLPQHMCTDLNGGGRATLLLRVTEQTEGVSSTPWGTRRILKYGVGGPVLLWFRPTTGTRGCLRAPRGCWLAISAFLPRIWDPWKPKRAENLSHLLKHEDQFKYPLYQQTSP